MVEGLRINPSDMNDAQRMEWQQILQDSRAVFSRADRKSTQDSAWNRSRHKNRGCTPSEVSELVSNGSYKNAFRAGQDPVIRPYDHVIEKIPDIEHGTFTLDLLYKATRRAIVNHQEVLILDTKKHYYTSSIVRLVNIANPDVPPSQQEDESMEDFLIGKEFRKVERFQYSENEEDDIEHRVDLGVAWWSTGEQGLDDALERLHKHIGYILNPVTIANMEPITEVLPHSLSA